MGDSLVSFSVIWIVVYDNFYRCFGLARRKLPLNNGSVGTFSQNLVAADDFRISDGPVRLDKNFQADSPTDASLSEDWGVFHRNLLDNFAGGVLCVAY